MTSCENVKIVHYTNIAKFSQVKNLGHKSFISHVETFLKETSDLLDELHFSWLKIKHYQDRYESSNSYLHNVMLNHLK